MNHKLPFGIAAICLMMFLVWMGLRTPQATVEDAAGAQAPHPTLVVAKSCCRTLQNDKKVDPPMEMAYETSVEFTVPAEAAPPSAYQIEDFPIIWQMPELPTGCEVTALTMALQYYGYEVSKTTMAAEYLPTTYPSLTYGEGGVLFGPDLNNFFVGDPFSEWGYICGVPAILTAANDYLAAHGASHTAIDVSSSSPEELYALVAQNVPVVVWVTIEMADRAEAQGWYTESGKYVDWSTNDHGAVLVGYTEETVTIADPISGLMEYDRQQFESVFESRGRHCVILSKSQEVEA